MIRRLTLATLPVALLVLAAPAAGKDRRQHTTYRAALAPVVAEEPTASPSRRGHSDEAAAVRGKAVLVDGRKRDRVKLRVRGLERGVSHTWEVRRGGCAGEAVGGFRYRALKVRRGGAKGRGSSRSFTAAAGASYALVVSGPEGDVACGEFERKGSRKRGGKQPEEGKDEVAGCDDEPVDDEPADDEPADDEPAEGYHAGAAGYDDTDEGCDEAADDPELDDDELDDDYGDDQTADEDAEDEDF